ncbi:MAG: hypothetical protein IKM30_01640 [Oscillospiraceae bacterium]|nr:hypothetical protein [Oscillospiraceae bacterium]
MNRPITYLCNVIVTLLLIFSLAATAVLSVIQCYSLRADTCIALLGKHQLADRVYDNLDSYYHEQANTSGIPASVYMDSISKEQISEIIHASVVNAFAYLHGADTMEQVETDFSKLEENLISFFRTYAEENGYEKDAAFEKTVDTAVANAKRNIMTTADVFRFYTLYDAKVLDKARAVTPLVPKALAAGIVLTAVLLGLLAWIHRKRIYQMLYWAAAAMFAASVLMILPMTWINGTRWFDRFAVKSDQIFTAVTGYLYGNTGMVLMIGILGVVIAAALWIVFALLHRHMLQKQSA